MSLLTIPEGQEGVNKVGQGAAPSYFALDLSLPIWLKLDFTGNDQSSC